MQDSFLTGGTSYRPWHTDHSRIERPGIIAQKMRIVFMGTPDFAARILQMLLESLKFAEVAAVYSRPDAISKRGKAVVPSAVSRVAIENNLSLFRPETLRNEEAQQQLRDLCPDLIVVAAYGMILPKEVLDIPPRGCVNVHASLLPRWRGAAPIERAILAGDMQIGVSIMQMEEGLDTGPYCAIVSTDIGEKTATELHCELADMGGQLLFDNLPALLGDSAQWTTQDEVAVTYAHKIEKSELRLSPELHTVDFIRRVRASSESAPARLSIAGQGATILEAASIIPSTELCTAICNSIPERSEECRRQGSYPSEESTVKIIPERSAQHRVEGSQRMCVVPQGTVQIIKQQGKRHVILGCADGSVELLTVKPDNKRAMSAADWLNGFKGVKEGLQWD
ncbi:MAG: methionyl-tRNA formyltransferase [Coriobacteriia bacterium]|nr:methionyl-tRNA formyltransferase [Coriobacteriia bacterium]